VLKQIKKPTEINTHVFSDCGTRAGLMARRQLLLLVGSGVWITGLGAFFLYPLVVEALLSCYGSQRNKKIW